MAAPVKPKCKTCGTSANVHAVSRPGMIPGAALSHAWLCGDCEYLIEHADAPRIEPPLRVNRLHPQTETLLAREGTVS